MRDSLRDVIKNCSRGVSNFIVEIVDDFSIYSEEMFLKLYKDQLDNFIVEQVSYNELFMRWDISVRRKKK